MLAADTSLRVVLPVPLWARQRFATESLVAFPDLIRALYCDPTGTCFRVLGCNLQFATTKLRPNSIHDRTSVLAATMKGIAEGLRGGPQGDPRQQGGCFVVEGEALVWAHLDTYNADQVPIPVLVAASGLPPDTYVHKLHVSP